MISRFNAFLLALFLSLAPSWAQMGQIPAYVQPAPSGGGCSQATAFLARTSGLSGTESGAYTTMICGMVTDGTITGNLTTTGCGALFDVLYIYVTNSTTTAGLNICGTNYTATSNGSPTFVVDAGYTGASLSSTVFLDTNFNAATATSPNFVKNSAHISCWILNTSPDFTCAGVRSGSDDTAILPSFSGATIGRVNESDGNGGFTIAGSPKGWYVANRSGASTSQIYQNGSLVASPNTTSTNLTGSDVYGLAFNNNTSANGASYQQAMMSIGGSMTGPQAASVYSRVCTFLTTVHGSC